MTNETAFEIVKQHLRYCHEQAELVGTIQGGYWGRAQALDILLREVEQSRAAVEAWEAVKEVMAGHIVEFDWSGEDDHPYVVIVNGQMADEKRFYGTTPQAAILAAKGE